MKRLPAGIFFVAAALYLMVTKPPDLITVIAIMACIALSGLATTKYSDWAAVGGGMLVAGSLFLQSLLSYRCIDCMRADILILAGVIILSIMERGRYRLMLMVLSSAIAVFTVAAMAAHFNPAVVFGMEPAKEIIAQIDSYESIKKETERYVQAVTADGRPVSLDTSVKPVLFFSPTCGACLRAVEALAKADPGGKRWVPVQSYGDPAKGRELLIEKGYRGESYVFSSKWRGVVPAMVGYGSKGLYKTNSQDEMLKIIRGDAG